MSKRMDRADSEIQKALSEIIEQKMNDPRVQKIVSIMDVSTSPDFRSCRVKISVLEVEKAEEMAKILQKSEGFLKRELAKLVDLPQIPKLIFEVDKSTENSIRVEELLKKITIPKEDENDQQ